LISLFIPLKNNEINNEINNGVNNGTLKDPNEEKILEVSQWKQQDWVLNQVRLKAQL